MKAIAGVLLAVCACGSFASDPFKPSENQQVELGEKAAADLRKQEKVLPDADPRVVLVRRVGFKLVGALHDVFKDKPWKFSFDVIDSKDVNAFALPGGPTFVYTGLLSHFKTEDELAGVLGHELTHVREQHWAHQYADQTKRALGLTVLLLVLRANSDVGNLAGISNELYSLKYSRSDESMADHEGMQAMVAAGYNPQGMVETFELLDQLVGKDAPMEMVSDHPANGRRIKAMQEEIKSFNRTDFPPEIVLDPNLVNPPPPPAPTTEPPKPAMPDKSGADPNPTPPPVATPTKTPTSTG